MRDQSHGRINGSAAAAFATICERNRNTGSVLKSAGEFDGVSMGQRYAQKFANPSRARSNNSDFKIPSGPRLAAPAVLKPHCEHNRGTGGKAEATRISNPCPVLPAWNGGWTSRIRPPLLCRSKQGRSMLMMKERRPTFRTIEGWATIILLEAGAIHECEEHGWMKDRANPHACQRALIIAREDPPIGVTSDQAVSAVEDVLGSISDTCPECLRES